jgi:hypothetical protein
MKLDRLRSFFSRTWVKVSIPLIGVCVAVAVFVTDDPGPRAPTTVTVVTDALGDAQPPEPAPDGEQTVSETAPAWLSWLAERYQPILRVARSDRFWPVSVGSVLSICSRKQHAPIPRARDLAVLREDQPGAADGTTICRQPDDLKTCLKPDCTTTCLHSIKKCPPPPTLANLSTDGHSNDYLTYPGSGDKVDETFVAMMNHFRFAHADWITSPSAKPHETAQIYFFASTKRPSADLPRDAEFLNLQYWFFYPFNYLPVEFKAPGLLGINPAEATKKNWGYHEGDFERVSVLLQNDPPGTPSGYVPKYVYMGRHTREGALFPWPVGEGTHPVIHAGFGGHASYERCGTHLRDAGFKRFRTIIGRFLRDYVICAENSPIEPKAPIGGVFEFRSDTPLVELKRNSWACWPGLFGRRGEKTVRAIAGLARLADGPRAPLRQFENKGVC